MVTIKELRDKTMTENKKKEAKNDLFAFYIGRPISYVFTIPCLAVGVKPNTISLISLIVSIIGFLLVSFGKSIDIVLLGWFFFFLWNIFDGVDGNIARYTNQTSKLGIIWDAAAGYTALALMLFSMSISVLNMEQIYILSGITKEYYLVMGGLSSIFVLLPRVIMHKKTIVFAEDSGKSFNDKENFSLIKILFLNIVSPSGFMQILMLLSIIFRVANIFVVFYFILELLICIYAYFKLLR